MFTVFVCAGKKERNFPRTSGVPGVVGVPVTGGGHTNFSRGRSGVLVFPSLSEFSTVYCDAHIEGFGIVNKAEVDVFLEPSCFFHDPADVGNLISGSSPFSKTSLNIWKFMVHILLKPWRILSITLLACEMSAIVR